MEICVLNPFFYPYQGGTEKVILEVYSRLAKHHNITVIAGSPEGSAEMVKEHVHGINVIRLKTQYIYTGWLPMPFLAMEGISHAVKEANADVYHINNRYQYFRSTINPIKALNRKLVLTLHNALPQDIDPLTDAAGLFYDTVWGREVMHASDLITAVSNNTLDTTVPERDKSKAIVIYNGVDHKKFKYRPKWSSQVTTTTRALGLTNHGTKTIMTTGRLIPQKGQKYLIKAVGELIKQGHNLDLLILGRGPMKNELYSIAKRCKIKNFSIFAADDDSIPYCYNAADIFVAPSLYEPASIALLEALSSEVPSVVADVGGMPEMAEGNCLYIQPKDVSGIKKDIVKILNNHKMAMQKAHTGRELMVKKHNWNKIAKQYEHHFESLIHY